jgi:hypothetical protein
VRAKHEKEMCCRQTTTGIVELTDAAGETDATSAHERARFLRASLIIHTGRDLPGKRSLCLAARKLHHAHLPSPTAATTCWRPQQTPRRPKVCVPTLTALLITSPAAVPISTLNFTSLPSISPHSARLTVRPAQSRASQALARLLACLPNHSQTAKKQRHRLSHADRQRPGQPVSCRSSPSSTAPTTLCYSCTRLRDLTLPILRATLRLVPSR